MVKIGVLALQGDFLEHVTTLNRLGISSQEIRLPQDLEKIDGIILPGGESTAMVHLLDEFGLRDPLTRLIEDGLPVWGTCAGMILLAKKLVQNKPAPLGLMDITVDRNAFGRQIESFTLPLPIAVLGDKPLHATFIRAPKVTAVNKSVTVLSRLDDGSIVAAQQENMLATSFHPELTQDTRLHEYFLSMISDKRNRK